jgi:CRISPR/Cas system-associated endoribonuclease Cas2
VNKVRRVLAAACLLWLAQPSTAQDRARYPEALPGISEAYYTAFDDDNPYATQEMLNHIRREKFDLILPRVMRDAEVDMWIHIIRPWTFSGNERRKLEGLDLNYSNIDSTDPLRYEFGSNAAVLVFTDRGGGRIERVVFEGEVDDAGAFDIVRGQSKFINQENYEIMDYVKENPDDVPQSEMGYRFMGLGDFVAERDPERIGVNYAEKLSFAEGSETHTLALTDGISYADHLHLSQALGGTYAERMVSAENMILDYLTSIVAGEIVLFGGSGLPRQIRTFPKIVPGVTTLRDVSGSWFSTREWDHDESAFENFPLQQGDMFQDGMVPYYVLREGETEPPLEVERSWDEVVRVRELIGRNIRVGDTGRQALARIIDELEEAGFAYIDRDRFDPSLDPGKTQVHLDIHQVGKGVLAPRVSPMGARWQADKKIPLLLTLGIEYMVHMPVPEWGEGRHIYYCSLHERGVVTERGVEFAAPPVAGIQSIH